MSVSMYFVLRFSDVDGQLVVNIPVSVNLFAMSILYMSK